MIKFGPKQWEASKCLGTRDSQAFKCLKFNSNEHISIVSNMLMGIDEGDHMSMLF